MSDGIFLAFYLLGLACGTVVVYAAMDDNPLAAGLAIILALVIGVAGLVTNNGGESRSLLKNVLYVKK